VTRVLAALAVGAGVGAGAVWIARDPADPPAPPARSAAEHETPVGEPGTAEAEIERLRAELALERAMRERLTEEIAVLESLLEHEGELAAEDGRGPAGAAGAGEGDEPGEATPGDEPSAGLDAGALAALGYPPGEIDYLREVWEGAVLERLERQHDRMREDRNDGRTRLRDALVLEKRLREDLGDDAYDAMLYGAGEENRVILADLLERSPARAAGLEPGDELISYAGERVFQPVSLKLLTAAGEAGRPVELRVRRDGEIVRVFVPRGPLGARLDVDTREPVR